MSLSAVTDTLRFFTSRPKAAKKKEKKKKTEEEEAADSIPPKIPALKLSMVTSSSQEVYLPLVMEFETPLERLDSGAFHLETLVDSTWVAVNKEWKLQPYDSASIRRMKIEYPWDYETEYRLTADSIAATGIYGLVTDPFEHKFKTKSEEDYCSLILNITNFTDSVPAFAELVNTSDAPVARVKVENGVARFQHLAPGKYYARIYEDYDGNGLYTTGDLSLNRQPDNVYYYPKIINLKKNWEKTETWNVFDTAVDLMKPEALKKNKPEADKRSRGKKGNSGNEEEEEEEYFDPTRNPFDPNDKGRNRRR